MSAPRRTTRRSPARREGIHICPECRSNLVQPIDWCERDADNWAVELRCPECEWIGGGIFSQIQVDRYDRMLDDSQQSIINDLKKLTRENMENDVEHFTEALWAERILPEDF
jgi:hypothetical protein